MSDDFKNPDMRASVEFNAILKMLSERKEKNFRCVSQKGRENPSTTFNLKNIFFREYVEASSTFLKRFKRTQPTRTEKIK